MAVSCRGNGNKGLEESSTRYLMFQGISLRHAFYHAILEFQFKVGLYFDNLNFSQQKNCYKFSGRISIWIQCTWTESLW